MRATAPLRRRGLPLRAYFASLIVLLVAVVGSASTYAAMQMDHEARRLVIVLAGVAVSILGAWLIYRRVVAPLRTLSGAVRSMSDLPALVPVPAIGRERLRSLPRM